MSLHHVVLRRLRSLSAIPPPGQARLAGFPGGHAHPFRSLSHTPVTPSRLAGRKDPTTKGRRPGTRLKTQSGAQVVGLRAREQEREPTLRSGYASFEDKLEHLPFQAPYHVVKEIMQDAADRAVLPAGFASVALLFLRGLARLLRLPLAPLANPLGFRSLWVPYWTGCLVARANANMGSSSSQLSMSCMAMVASGTSMHPLSRLPLEIPFAASSKPWSTRHQGAKIGNPTDDIENTSASEEMGIVDGEAPTVIPFTRAPTRLLQRARAMNPVDCKLKEEGGGFSLRWNPKSVEIPFVASHPVYLPIYLGEFEAVDSKEERVTVAVMAHSRLPNTLGKAASIQGQGLQCAVWNSALQAWYPHGILPSAYAAVTPPVTLSGRVGIHAPSEALMPQSSPESSEADGGGSSFLQSMKHRAMGAINAEGSTEWLAEAKYMEEGSEGDVREAARIAPEVLPHGEFSGAVREYLGEWENVTKLELGMKMTVNMLKQLEDGSSDEDGPTTTKVLQLSKRGVHFFDATEAKREAEEQLRALQEQKKKFESAKPRWVRALEQRRQEVEQA